MTDGVLGSPAPRIIAHRTCLRHVAENSLAGIRLAADLGADGVELDVRLTRDGVPVLLHDPLLVRTTGVPWPVRWAPWSLVRRLRLRDAKGETVPSLADALGLVATLPRSFSVAIDTKDPAAVDAVCAEVERRGLWGRAQLWSQHEVAVRRYAERAPTGTEVALLRDVLSAPGKERFLADAAAWGATAVSAHPRGLSGGFLPAAASRRLAVYTWFQDLDRQLDLLRADGPALPVHGVVTGWVEEAVAWRSALDAGGEPASDAGGSSRDDAGEY